MRVLQVLACDDVGGTEAMTAALVERLDRRRVTADVATLAGPGPVASRLSGAGVRVDSLGGSGLVRAAWSLAGLIHRRRYDVLNAYGFKATMIARLVARIVDPRLTFVCGVRGLHVTETEDLGGPKARLALALERIGSPLVDIYDANSTGAVELLAAAGIDRERLRYIPNGIDVTRWERRTDSVAPGLEPLILCVARFVPRKRHQDLVEALALLRDRGTPFRAVLAGEGPTRRSIEELVHRLGVGEAIRFPGSVRSAGIAAVMEEAAVFCLPSLWEGMPGAVMEAMASGVPVVGTAVNGTEDLLVDGVSGLLVPPRDPERLAGALERVLTDHDLARTIGLGGRRRIEEHFSLERMVEAKEELYLAAAEIR